MLRIIAGLELPDEGGRVLFDGNDMTAMPIERRNVGMVFQSYALFPNMNVADNIGYSLTIRGMPRRSATARVAELVALTNISRPGASPDRPAFRRAAPTRGVGARGRDPAEHPAARRAVDRA